MIFNQTILECRVCGERMPAFLSCSGQPRFCCPACGCTVMPRMLGGDGAGADQKLKREESRRTKETFVALPG